VCIEGPINPISYVPITSSDPYSSSLIVKKHWKIIKNRGASVALVVEEDLEVSQVEEMEGRAIVVKFCGRRM
jgi:hypothetical protein